MQKRSHNSVKKPRLEQNNFRWAIGSDQDCLDLEVMPKSEGT